MALSPQWKITTNYNPEAWTLKRGVLAFAGFACISDIWVTYKGELNDTPAGKAAVRSCAAVRDGRVHVARNLHFQGGLLWDPDSKKPALWDDFGFSRGDGVDIGFLEGVLPSSLTNPELHEGRRWAKSLHLLSATVLRRMVS